VLWVWSIAFNNRPWLSSFGAVIFVITGLFLGVIYFFSFYQWYKHIREIERAAKRRLSYVALVLVIAFISHWLIQGVLWVGHWMGNTYGIAFWLFIGFILSGFVLYTKDRLFHWLQELFI
jgi:hypothetical protein